MIFIRRTVKWYKKTVLRKEDGIFRGTTSIRRYVTILALQTTIIVLCCNGQSRCSLLARAFGAQLRGCISQRLVLSHTNRQLSLSSGLCYFFPIIAFMDLFYNSKTSLSSVFRYFFAKLFIFMHFIFCFAECVRRYYRRMSRVYDNSFFCFDSFFAFITEFPFEALGKISFVGWI